MTNILVRVTCIITAVSMILMNVGCESRNIEENSEQQDDKKIEKVTIRYDTWYPPQQIMNEILDKFHERHPEIEVEVTITDPVMRMQTLPVRMASGENIDLIGVGLNQSFEYLYQYFEPIEPLMDEHVGSDWKQRLNDSSLAFAGSFTGGDLYCIPIGRIGSPVVYYNGDIFDEYGLEEPKTYKELQRIVDILKEKESDITPIVFRGQLSHLHILSLIGIYGQKFDVGNYLHDTHKFNDPKVVEAVEFWIELFDRDIISKVNLDVDNSRSLEMFYTGQAAMMINGTWMAGVLSEQYREKNSIDIEEIGAFMFPALEDGLTPTLAVTPDLSIAVGRNTKDIKAVMTLYEFMLFGEGMEIMAENLLVLPSDVTYEIDESVFTDKRGLAGYHNIIDGMDQSHNPLRTLDSTVREFGRIIQAGVAGDGSVETLLDQYQKEVDEAK